MHETRPTRLVASARAAAGGAHHRPAADGAAEAEAKAEAEEGTGGQGGGQGGQGSEPAARLTQV